MINILLASQSPRRHDLIQLTGANVTTLSTDINETVKPDEAPTDYVARLSREKAAAAAATQSTECQMIIVAADTSVIDAGDILGKPANFDEAQALLQRLRNRTHHVLTGITVIEYPTGQGLTHVVRSPIKMRNFTDEDIIRYVETGDPFDKAGGYGIQHQGFQPVKQFSHCFANVMGLPLCHLTRMLQQLEQQLAVDIATNCQQHLDYACPIYDVILNGGETL